MFDFKILFAIIFIIISDEIFKLSHAIFIILFLSTKIQNVNQVFSQLHVRVAYLFLEFSELFAECGVSRGISGLFCLSECNEDIQNHLASLHLSRSRLTERDVILARVGMFELDETVIENMKICAKHRHTVT